MEVKVESHKFFSMSFNSSATLPIETCHIPSTIIKNIESVCTTVNKTCDFPANEVLLQLITTDMRIMEMAMDLVSQTPELLSISYNGWRIYLPMASDPIGAITIV